MKTCFLFGHSDTPPTILPGLIQAVRQEVASGVCAFYVGYHGSFDRLAASAVRAVKREHPQVSLYLVLAYHPAEHPIPLPEGFDGSFYPPLHGVPRRYAILWANRYMADHADSILCYGSHRGNTGALLAHARHRGDLPIHNLFPVESHPLG